VLEEVMKKSKSGKMRVEKIVKIGNKDEKEKESVSYRQAFICE
jgi:hypothetical protein